MEKNFKKWHNTGLLNNFKSEKKQSICNCLESQLKFNENNNNSLWNKFSLPVVVRFFQESKVFDKNNFKSYSESNSDSQIYVFKTKFSVPGIWKENLECKPKRLQQQADYIGTLCKKLRNEFDNTFADQTYKNIYFEGIGVNKAGSIYLKYTF